MKKLLLLLLFLTCPVFAADYKLMVFGDSLSAGYRLPQTDSFYAQLEKALHDKGYTNIQVIHQSKSGETTAGGLRRLNQALEQNPNGVMIELGINDVFRHTPVATIENNLDTMITAFQNKGVNVMLIGMQAPPTDTPAYRQEFATMYQKLAQKYRLILYPFFMKDVISFNPITMNFSAENVLIDHIHPNKKGVAIMVKNILPDVIRFIKQSR